MTAGARRRLFAVALAAFATLIWGGWFPISRLAVTTGLTPADVAFLRFGVAGLVLLPVCLRQGFRAGRAGCWGSLAMTATIGVPFPLLLATGLQFAPAAHAAVFVPGVFPGLTFILGVLLLRDPVTWRRLAGICLVAAGVGMVAWVALESRSPGELRGYLLFHLCAWLWALYTIVARVARIGPLHATAILSVLSMLIYLPPYLLFAESGLPGLPPAELLFQVAYHSLLGGILSMLCYNHAVNVLGASQAAIFGGLVPCIAALLSVPILGETLGLREVLGLAAVTAGIALVTGARMPAEKGEPAGPA